MTVYIFVETVDGKRAMFDPRVANDCLASDDGMLQLLLDTDVVMTLGPNQWRSVSKQYMNPKTSDALAELG